MRSERAIESCVVMIVFVPEKHFKYAIKCQYKKTLNNQTFYCVKTMFHDFIQSVSTHYLHLFD